MELKVANKKMLFIFVALMCCLIGMGGWALIGGVGSFDIAETYTPPRESTLQLVQEHDLVLLVDYRLNPAHAFDLSKRDEEMPGKATRADRIAASALRLWSLGLKEELPLKPGDLPYLSDYARMGKAEQQEFVQERSRELAARLEVVYPGFFERVTYRVAYSDL